MGLQQRVEEDYEEEEYDEYEEDAYEPEEEQEPEAPKLTMEEQEFLKSREQLKEKIRQRMNKQSANASSRLSQKRTIPNDKFGSFFGPSQPVIASRVIEESRLIRENKHIVSKNKRDPTSSETKTYVHHQKPKVVNELKKKAQTLKDMRDYSFLLSDDADLPSPEREKPPPLRNVSVSKSDGQSAQTPSSRIPTSKPLRSTSIGNELKKASTNRHMQIKAGSVKEAPVSRSKLASSKSRKVLGSAGGNGSIQTTKVISTANKALPSKIPAQVMGTNRAPMKATGDTSLKNPSAKKVQSSAQNHHPGQKRVSQGPDNLITAPKQRLHSSKAQPPKQIHSRGIHDDRSKKRPAKRHFDEEEEDIDDVRGLIRQMFRYDPSKYAGNDEDDSDMEVGFDRIQKEEFMSSEIGRREDEEQLRLIEQEEREEIRRKMMRKRQKQF